MVKAFRIEYLDASSTDKALKETPKFFSRYNGIIRDYQG